jgi:hypothetical protein
MLLAVALIGVADMRVSGARGNASDVLSVLALASPAVLLGIVALAWPGGNRERRTMAWCGIGAAMSVPRWCCSSFWPNRWRDEDQARVSSAVLTGQQARLACIGQPWFGRYQTNPRPSSSDGLRTSARIDAFRAVITQDPHPCPAAKVRAVNCSATGTASGARDSAGTCVLAIGERRRVAAGPRCARFGWLVPLPQKVPERAFLKLDSWGGGHARDGR